MKTVLRIFSVLKKSWPALPLVLVGCTTTPKIDWQSRIGHYSYDQAILDFGPPSKSAKLADGTVVADWLTRRGYVSRNYISPGFYSYHCHYYAPFFLNYYDTYSPDYFLRLTFGPDEQLQTWKKFCK